MDIMDLNHRLLNLVHIVGAQSRGLGPNPRDSNLTDVRCGLGMRSLRSLSVGSKVH